MTEVNARLALAALRYSGEVKGYPKDSLATVAATLAGKDHEKPRKMVEDCIRETSKIRFELTPEDWGELAEELTRRI